VKKNVSKRQQTLLIDINPLKMLFLRGEMAATIF